LIDINNINVPGQRICSHFLVQIPRADAEIVTNKLPLIFPLLSTLGRSRIHFEDSPFNVSLVTATSTRIQSEDVLHGAHVIDEM
jgi:hypothetical protein